MSLRAVFLDRDGVLVRHITERGPRETPVVPDEVKLEKGVPEGLAALWDADYILAVVTNQPDVAKGKVSWETIWAIETRFQALVGSALVLHYYACYHHPDVAQVVVPELLCKCDCRKPKPGLILRAANDLDLDLSRSWLIGDQPSDIEAGRASGLPPDHLILVGQPTQAHPFELTAVDFITAVGIVLKEEEQS